MHIHFSSIYLSLERWKIFKLKTKNLKPMTRPLSPSLFSLIAQRCYSNKEWQTTALNSSVSTD